MKYSVWNQYLGKKGDYSITPLPPICPLEGSPLRPLQYTGAYSLLNPSLYSITYTLHTLIIISFVQHYIVSARTYLLTSCDIYRVKTYRGTIDLPEGMTIGTNTATL